MDMPTTACMPRAGASAMDEGGHRPDTPRPHLPQFDQTLKNVAKLQTLSQKLERMEQLLLTLNPLPPKGGEAYGLSHPRLLLDAAAEEGEKRKIQESEKEQDIERKSSRLSHM